MEAPPKRSNCASLVAVKYEVPTGTYANVTLLTPLSYRSASALELTLGITCIAYRELVTVDVNVSSWTYRCFVTLCPAL